MGEQVVPLYASPRSLFLRTWEVSSQSLKTVVSSVKNFRWAVPGVDVSPDAGPLIERNDVWWLLLSHIPILCMSFALLKLTGDPHVYKILQVLDLILLLGGPLTHIVVVHSIMYWYRDMPFSLIGAKAIFLIEVIPMIVASALHHLLRFNYGYLYLLLGFTIYIYTFAHFMHVAYDIGGKDVLLGLLMQIPFYILNGKLLIRSLALSFCVMLCFYKYMMYSAPEVPEHRKKELEQLPC